MSLVLGWHCIVQPIWFLLVLHSAVICARLVRYDAVSWFWLVLHSTVSLVLVGTVSAASLVLPGVVWCSQFGSWLALHSAVSLVLGWYC